MVIMAKIIIIVIRTIIRIITTKMMIARIIILDGIAAIQSFGLQVLGSSRGSVLFHGGGA